MSDLYWYAIVFNVGFSIGACVVMLLDFRGRP